MGRRGNPWAKKIKRFLALLKKNDCEDSLQTKLIDEAGKLCQNLLHTSCSLRKLVKVMEQGKHWRFLLTNIHIVRASVLVHIRSSQYDVACKLLENCRAIEKEELVQLWNEIHYQEAMEKWHKQFLTPVQKFRCRKRNPPPASLCPEGVKNRNYPKEVRQVLQKFAMEKTAKPNRQQKEGLARTTNLQLQHISNWFANYRRRQKIRPTIAVVRKSDSHPEDPVQSPDELHEVAGLKPMEMPLASSDPSWGQVVGYQGCSSKETFLFPVSISQNGHLEGFDSSPESMNTIETNQSTVFHSQAEEQHGQIFDIANVESRWEPSSTTSSLWMQNSSHSSYDLHPTQQWAERLPVSRIASEDTSKTDQCICWSLDAPYSKCTYNRMSPNVCVEVKAQTVEEQAEKESFVLRGRQLMSLEASLPPRSFVAEGQRTGLVANAERR
uniref:Uncharacterized protein n=1 Tax=Sphaerodactylus townsendi TaxID=933632 RepID=A0ACB8FZG9_9SAUR